MAIIFQIYIIAHFEVKNKVTDKLWEAQTNKIKVPERNVTDK